MTTTSLKHIVSNVENIRNPVITHCYYGNQPLLPFLFSLCLCFPLFYVLFIFVPFFCNRCLFLVFATHFSFSILVRPLILVALHFAYRPLDPHLYLLSICLANTSLSDPINGMRTLFAPGVWSPLLLYPHFYRYHLAGISHWIRMVRRRYVGC